MILEMFTRDWTVSYSYFHYYYRFLDFFQYVFVIYFVIFFVKLCHVLPTSIVLLKYWGSFLVFAIVVIVFFRNMFYDSHPCHYATIDVKTKYRQVWFFVVFSTNGAMVFLL